MKIFAEFGFINPLVLISQHNPTSTYASNDLFINSVIGADGKSLLLHALCVDESWETKRWAKEHWKYWAAMMQRWLTVSWCEFNWNMYSIWIFWCHRLTFSQVKVIKRVRICTPVPDVICAGNGKKFIVSMHFCSDKTWKWKMETKEKCEQKVAPFC